MVKTNLQLEKLIGELRSRESKLLIRIASDLEKPSRRRREVNISRINKFTKENEVIIVPGKVLGGGELNHKVTISAYKFSDGAIDKLKRSGSEIIPINQIKKENIAGKKVRIIG